MLPTVKEITAGVRGKVGRGRRAVAGTGGLVRITLPVGRVSTRDIQSGSVHRKRVSALRL